MSNQSEVDYDKQFQDDLAKATALSLEQQVLDDYQRAKKYGSAAVYYNERTQSQSPSLQLPHSSHQRQQSNESAMAFYSQLRTRYQQSRGNSNDTTIAPPPVPPSRRLSEANNNISLNVAAVTAASRERSKTPPTTLPESDLISFSSPTAKEAQPNTFEKLIEDLQKLQASSTQTALVPLGPVAAAPITPMHAAAGYRGTPPTLGTPTHQNVMYAAGGGVTGGNCMQLVPFTPSHPTQQQKVPLNGEELQKLYNTPLQQQQQARYFQQQQQHQHMAAIMPAGGIYPASHIGFVPPMGGYAAHPQTNLSQSAPSSATASAAYTPPHFPTTGSHYGYQYAGAASYYASSAASTASNVSATAAALIPLAKSQSAAASIITNGSNNSIAGGNGLTTGNTGLRRQTPPARKSQRTGNDLIDLNQDDDSRVSVLEAFDPLLNTDESVWKK